MSRIKERVEMTEAFTNFYNKGASKPELRITFILLEAILEKEIDIPEKPKLLAAKVLQSGAIVIMGAKRGQFCYISAYY
ncbi:MAG: hypothetical protein ACE5KD_00780 [Candidatus Bathyarchaeia archaeon]